MDVRVLKTLVAVAEHGTFAAAANAVGLSPSAVSMQIQALEQHLSAELFDRSRRPPVLNEKGMALLPTARKIISLHDSLRDVAAPPDDFIGRLRLGVIPTALSSFVPAALAGLTRAHPLIEVQIVTAMNTPLFKLLNNEELDAAIIGKPPSLPSGLLWRPFVKEMICAIAPADAAGDTAEELLRTYPYINLIRGAWQLRMIEEQVSKMALSLRTIMQLDSIEAVTLMVHHGLGVSIVPRREMESLLRLRIKSVPFGNPPLFRTLGFVHPQGSPKTHLCDAVFDKLVKVCRRRPETDLASYPAERELPLSV
ncbi:MAG TPA: LysR substrate-binding domain-containing protein [Pseudolabrys sp.]|nr:LysR substrate-binding domain-containing protein [Pseudolabrys sp.]